MAAQLISGIEIARQIREELKEETARLKEKFNVAPGLVTILVGQNPASMSYVTAKQKASKELGFHSIQENRPESITETDLLALIDGYNRDPKIHGILVQLPLPKHINETKVLYAIDPKKDVDGFHPVNVGKMMIGEADYLPCTPAGIQQLLIRSGVKTDGAEVVVVGPVEYRRQTDHEHPAAETKGGERHGDDLPYGDAGHRLSYPPGGHSHRCRREAEGHHGGDGQRGGGGDRCGRQSDRYDAGRKGQALRRRRFRCGQGKGVPDHAGTRGSGADDDHDADAQYRQGG